MFHHFGLIPSHIGDIFYISCFHLIYWWNCCVAAHQPLQGFSFSFSKSKDQFPSIDIFVFVWQDRWVDRDSSHSCASAERGERAKSPSIFLIVSFIFYSIAQANPDSLLPSHLRNREQKFEDTYQWRQREAEAEAQEGENPSFKFSSVLILSTEIISRSLLYLLLLFKWQILPPPHR